MTDTRRAEFVRKLDALLSMAPDCGGPDFAEARTDLLAAYDAAAGREGQPVATIVVSTHGDGGAPVETLQVLPEDGKWKRHPMTYSLSHWHGTKLYLHPAPKSDPVCWYDPDDFTRTSSQRTEKEWAPLYRHPPKADAAAGREGRFPHASEVGCIIANGVCIRTSCPNHGGGSLTCAAESPLGLQQGDARQAGASESETEGPTHPTPKVDEVEQHGQPVAHVDVEPAKGWPDRKIGILHCDVPVGTKLYLHPAPKADAAADWVLVPREPTEAMEKAGAMRFLCRCNRTITQWAANRWEEMLDAAPASPARVGDDRDYGKVWHDHYYQAFMRWLEDDSTHWINDKDAAWQAWMYLHEEGLTTYPEAAMSREAQ